MANNPSLAAATARVRLAQSEIRGARAGALPHVSIDAQEELEVFAGHLEAALKSLGVKDATNLGGHGSDTIVHARSSLAKDTASLGKPSVSGSTDASEIAKSLRDQLIRDPDNAEIHHHLGNLEEQLGDPLEAVRQYERAAELNSTESYLFDWGSQLLLHHAPEPAHFPAASGSR